MQTLGNQGGTMERRANVHPMRRRILGPRCNGKRFQRKRERWSKENVGLLELPGTWASKKTLSIPSRSRGAKTRTAMPNM